MTQKLLFVDDSLTMHRVMAITFGQQDVVLVGAHSAAEALALYASHPCDVAIIDVHLGDQDGYTLCQELQKLRPPQDPLPVLLLASAQHPIDESRMRAAGAAGSVSKPFDTQTLLARVHEATLRATSAAAAVPTTHEQPAKPREAQQVPPPLPSRPANFFAPPPLPQATPKGAHSWAIGGAPVAPVAAVLPDERQLPSLPTWTIAQATPPPQADDIPPPVATPPSVPLWSDKESSTADDLRQPQIDADVTALARKDNRHYVSAQSSAKTAIDKALSQLPENTQQQLGPQFAHALSDVLVQAIERAVWDVLPIIAKQEAQNYLQQHPPR